MEVRWNRMTRAHICKHATESPEINPEFVERILAEAHPTHLYPDKVHPARLVFEGYFPPDLGRPYRVIFELDDEGGVWPVAAFRIADQQFIRKRAR